MMDILNEIKIQKYESKKYQVMARYIENLCGKLNKEELINLENNQHINKYIRYIGGIGNSRGLEFCVSKREKEIKIIQTIEYVLDKMKEKGQKIKTSTINNMLNNAIINEQEELIFYIFNKTGLKEKIDFSYGNYMTIKNMTNPKQIEERKLLKQMIIDKTIPLNEKIRNYIKKSKDTSIEDLISRMELKEKIETSLPEKAEVKIKKNKI